MAKHRPVVLSEMPALSSTGWQGPHRTYGKAIGVQSRCVRDTSEGTAGRFGSFVQAYVASQARSVSVDQRLKPTTAVRHVLTHLHSADAEKVMNRKPITLGSRMIWLLPNSPSSSFNNPFLRPLMIQSTQVNDFHSVPGSQLIHAQGHFEQHLVILEISFTSSTGLQQHYRQQSLLLPGLQSPAWLFWCCREQRFLV